GVARGEVPVEAALGHAEPARQRLDRNRRHAMLGNQVQRSLGPVLGAQAPLAFRLVGCRCRCGRRHRHSVSIRHRLEQYRRAQAVVRRSIRGTGIRTLHPLDSHGPPTAPPNTDPCTCSRCPSGHTGRLDGKRGATRLRCGGAMLRTLLVLLLACSGGIALHADAAPSRASQEDARVQAAMAVPEDLRQAVAALELDRAGIPQLDRVRRLFEFMVAEDGLGLHYQEQPTYDISGSHAQRKVNCLSFTMMFIALARSVGINAYAQASQDALAIRVVDDTVFRAKHVKAGVDIEGTQYTVDVGWRSV